MKQKFKLIILILSISIIGLTCKKPPVDTTGNIQGTVKTTNGIPIDGATLKINSTPNEQTAITKSDGTYAFNELQPNSYQIVASKTGYTDNSQNLTVIVGETKTLDIILNQYNPTFTATSPTAGVNWIINSTENITWTSTGLTGNIKIELFKNATLLKSIETSTENDGTYPWLISSEITPSTDYKIKLTSLSEPTVFDESDFFSISTVLPTLTLTPTNQNVSMTAGTTNFTVNSNTNWTTTSNQTWCTVTTSGTGNGTITANYTENTSGSQRTATITVSANGVTSQNVTVTQSYIASTLTVTPSNQNVSMTSGTTNFTVNSNTNWTATSDQTWCTVTTSGTGNGTITANYTENTSGSQRTATITVSASGVTNQNVTVTQSYIVSNLSVTPSNQNVTMTAGNTIFSVSSNLSWSVVSDQSWCTVTTSGTGNGTITATYTQNPANSQRVATITISASGVSNQIVTVTQSENSLVNGLVAFYPFNGNANDESGNGNIGTVNGATTTTDRKGNANSAFSFDGINDNITFTTIPSNQLVSLTVSLWVLPNSLNQFGIALLYGYDNGSTLGDGFEIGIANNVINPYPGTGDKLQFAHGNVAFLNGNYTFVNTSNWVHLVIKRQNSQSVIYVNGIQTISHSNTIKTPTSFKIGSILNSRFFNGKIDDIKIYNRSLTDSEIQQLYNE